MKKEQIVQFINEDKPLSRLIHDYDIGFHSGFNHERYNNIELKRYIEDDLCSSFKHIFESNKIDKIRGVLQAVQNLWLQSSKTYILNEIILPYLNNTDKELRLILEGEEYNLSLNYVNDKLIGLFNGFENVKEINTIKLSIIKTLVEIRALTKKHKIHHEFLGELNVEILKINNLGEYEKVLRPSIPIEILKKNYESDMKINRIIRTVGYTAFAVAFLMILAVLVDVLIL